MKERTRARGWALQALYAWEARGGRDENLVATLDDLSRNLQISPRNRLYTEVLVRLVARRGTEIDDLLRRHLRNWSLSRLAVIDRSILRIGVAELLWIDDVPPAVTLQEMMRLADRYGTPESGRFVNGVLAAVAREDAGGGAGEAP